MTQRTHYTPQDVVIATELPSTLDAICAAKHPLIFRQSGHTDEFMLSVMEKEVHEGAVVTAKLRITDLNTLDHHEFDAFERLKGGYVVATQVGSRKTVDDLASYLDTEKYMPGRDLKTSPDWEGDKLAFFRRRMESHGITGPTAVTHFDASPKSTAPSL